jgi:hypothetical protein
MLCGASQESALRYYDTIRRQRALDPAAQSIESFRVSMVAPPRRDTFKGIDRIGAVEGGLSTNERQQAFMVRRFNNLTIRQRAARRRRLWQRRSNGAGGMEWVRVHVVVSGGEGGGGGGGGGLSDDNDKTALLLPEGRDSFGDGAPMSHSPGFTSVLNPHKHGALGWVEETGVSKERFGPVKERIIRHASERADHEDRSSIHEVEVEDDADLVAIAALPFRRKQQWLQSCLEVMRGPDMLLPPGAAAVVKIHIRRDHLLEDSFSQIMSLEAALFSKKLRVVFVGEPGIDAGGLLREWFLLLVQPLFDPAFGLFVASGADTGYSINPVSGLCNSLHLDYFRFAGRIVGKALLEHQTLPVHFSLPMLKHMLSVPISFSDLEFEDGELYQNLVYLRDNAGADALDLDFTVTCEALGRRQTHDLVPGGRDIAVTDANKKDYLLRRFKFRMLDSVSEQLWGFLCGLYEVVPQEGLSVFDYQELELLIAGVPEIDLDDWQRHTRYVGLFKKAASKHIVCKWFWEVVEGFSQEDRARLLQFSTGTSRLPAQGFKALESYDGNFRNFTLAGVDKKDILIPRSHTCFNRIDLPTYDSKKELEGYLSLVINMEITGFSDE